uniref:Uncharacterized protein n=1 Tax=Solanum tuberosum TaxID=4113 RepID=M1DP03_SOLTU
MDLAREGKIELEDEKLSSNQVSVASDLPNTVMTCNFVDGNMEQEIPNNNQTRMIKFGDFEPIEVNKLLSLPILSDVASVGEGSTRQDEDVVDDLDDWGWTLVTRRRRRKVSSYKDSAKQHVREKMYYENGVAKRIIADDNPFTETEAHFVDAKFYLKKYSIKVDAIASGDVGPLNNMAKVAVGKAKVANKEDSNLGNPNKMPNVIGAFSSKKVTPILRYVPKAKEDKGHSLKLQENALEGLTLPVRRIDTVKSSTKLLGKSVAPKSLPHEKSLKLMISWRLFSTAPSSLASLSTSSLDITLFALMV